MTLPESVKRKDFAIQNAHKHADKDSAMNELIVPYVVALTMTSGLGVCAYRNRKQGWQRQRAASWLKMKPLEALPAVAEVHARTIHLGELLRLNDALLVHTAVPVEIEHPINVTR
jgi:hypothetical protein